MDSNTQILAHGFDADRKLIAREMDSGFFAKVGTQEDSPPLDQETLDMLKKLLQKQPDLSAKLTTHSENTQKV